MKGIYKKLGTVLCFGALLSTSLLFSPQALANDGNDTSRQPLIIDQDNAEVDPNHYETIKKLQDYVKENVEKGTFASLHIDREERSLGIIVLSFTKEVSTEMKKEIEALVEEPAEVKFRVVKYTEEGLIQKQREVDIVSFEEKVFKAEGINVFHTSSDIINSVVEIGISPYNDETAQMVYDYFDSEMINVVEGQQMHLLTEDATDDAKEVTTISVDIEKDEKRGFFARVWNWLTGLFN